MSIRLNPKDRTFIPDVKKEVLKEAPGFDSAHEVFTSREAGWLLDIYENYGFSPYWMPGK